MTATFALPEHVGQDGSSGCGPNLPTPPHRTQVRISASGARAVRIRVCSNVGICLSRTIVPLVARSSRASQRVRLGTKSPSNEMKSGLPASRNAVPQGTCGYRGTTLRHGFERASRVVVRTMAYPPWLSSRTCAVAGKIRHSSKSLPKDALQSVTISGRSAPSPQSPESTCNGLGGFVVTILGQ